ncbi:GNAT family N-acetyltransferase [Paenibacillus sp. PsM32]|uniref:GNAT family N-acetyltransferase n=1 Tax=Paenibacillus sp. PsM32 TaxID=3030536 RepID=UPI00263AEDFC|nr:GNAT family N-acetyltransferase [Paenibacillus sp. PsM32]MDN4617007.1 GNAT family N-acetyltransferase [Paenibacillus sp. PsM32]
MIRIEQVPPTDLHLRTLIQALDKDLQQRYDEENIYTIDLDHPDAFYTTFMVAYIDDTPVGCGAIRPLDTDSVELKRFFVDSTYRRQGIAGNMLQALEQKAIEQGCHFVRLETGAEQFEATAFYERNGYYRIPVFADYEDDGISLCYEKKLDLDK